MTDHDHVIVLNRFGFQGIDNILDLLSHGHSMHLCGCIGLRSGNFSTKKNGAAHFIIDVG